MKLNFENKKDNNNDDENENEDNNVDDGEMMLETLWNTQMSQVD